MFARELEATALPNGGLGLCLRWDGCGREFYKLCGIAAGTVEALNIARGLFVGGHGVECFAQDLRYGFISRRDDAVVLPQSFATRGYQSAAAKISQVAGDLWLAGLKSLHEKADANLSIAHEIEQTQARAIRQGSEKCIEIERVLAHLRQCIRFL